MLFLYFYLLFLVFFFFKQKTAYEMRISDWSSDVCSSDLGAQVAVFEQMQAIAQRMRRRLAERKHLLAQRAQFLAHMLRAMRFQRHKAVDGRDRKSVV